MSDIPRRRQSYLFSCVRFFCCYQVPPEEACFTVKDSLNLTDDDTKQMTLLTHKRLATINTEAHTLALATDPLFTEIRARKAVKNGEEFLQLGKTSIYQQAIYDDVELPYPDAKVAQKLCGGFSCFYLCDPALDVAMMNPLVLSYVVPNIKKCLPESVCLVLGKAFCWLICSPVVDQYVLEHLKQKVLPECMFAATMLMRN